MSVDDRSAALALAFEQGERAVQEQGRTLEGLRTRAGVVFSAAAVIGGVLAGFVVRDRPVDLGPWGWGGVMVGTAGFIVVLAAALAVSWPTEMRVNHDPLAIVEGYLDTEPPATLPEIHHWLAYHRHDDIEANRAALERRQWWLVAGFFAVLMQLGGLLMAVSDAAR